MNLILVRHGETEFNRQRLILGHGPEPLNATGQAQALSAAVAVSRDTPFVLYASPVVRTMQTAETIASECSVDFAPKPGLEEIDAGDLEGLTGAHLREQYPDVMRVWRDDPASAMMPNGETLGNVQARAWAAINDISQHHEDDTVVVVSHNFPIQAILCKALGMPLNNFRQVRVDLGSITRLEAKDSVFTLLSLNETWHL
ncbi:MAG: histidine phosphatase family protein [SAR202 cluster bacterium]|jgi:broad specificity phosphatase PhoE|nr:histidine phosphatase family protein [SAR202 cluster bacterium]